MMSNKALRLPIILLTLMIMAGIIQAVRPKGRLEPKPFRDASTVETFNASSTTGNITINGHNISEINSMETTYKPMSLQKSWNPTDIKRIEGNGSKQILVFIDGSTREVNPSLFKLLPGSIQARLSYDRDN
jgi:hypothetical protein